MIEICLLIIALALLPVAVRVSVALLIAAGWLSARRRVSFGFDSVDIGRGIRSIWVGRTFIHDRLSSYGCGSA